MGWLAALVCALVVAVCLGSPMELRRTRLVDRLNPKPTLKFSLTGERDANGHWTEQMVVKHGDEDWHVEADFHALQGGRGADPGIQLSAKITGKSRQQLADSNDSPRKDGTFLLLNRRSDLNWFEAKESCEVWGGNLAIPNSEQKMIQMTQMLNEYITTSGKIAPAFLGFGDQEEEGNFITIFGDPVFAPNAKGWSPSWWREDQPDDDKSWYSEGEDCGSLRQEGGLNDVPCRFTAPFFCEKGRGTEGGVDSIWNWGPQTQHVPIQTKDIKMNVGSTGDDTDEDSDSSVRDEDNVDDVEGSLDTDKEKIDIQPPQADPMVSLINGDTILQLNPVSDLDWFGAKEACEVWGGNLAIPDSEQKMVKMARLLDEYNFASEQNLPAFLGFGDQEEEGNFVTIFGDPVFAPRENGWSPRWWRADQPDDDKSWYSEGEDCGSLRQGVGGLNDVPCRFKAHFFCEKSLASEGGLKTQSEDVVEEGNEEDIETTTTQKIEEETVSLERGTTMANYMWGQDSDNNEDNSVSDFQ